MKRELELFKNICKVNDNIIKTEESITNVAFIIRKGHVEVCALLYKNSEEKEIMRQELFKNISDTKDLIGYILVFDTKITITNKNMDKDKTKIKDAVVRTFFTSKEMIREIVIYENHTILSKKTYKIQRDKKEDINFKDRWDFWGDWEMDEKVVEDYNKFKLNNKEKYKGTF